ncbi:MAG: deoxyribodipyrimidine photo-lyase [Saprospiraceae bacterium]|nr:MAG: deoxyribodipyrimidine photo-lyase [Saprospiraceae bacterium]
MRLRDNAGLYHALKGDYPVLPLFIFDKNILDDLEDKDDARVSFIHQVVTEIQEELQKLGSNLLVKYGNPLDIWEEIMATYPVNAIYSNRDYEPYAKTRDNRVGELVKKKGIPFHAYKDHVIFEKMEIEKEAGGPYTVFTPYSKKWLAKLKTKTAWHNEQEISFYLKPYPTEEYFDNFFQSDQPFDLPSLESMGFLSSKLSIPDKTVSRRIIRNYDSTRDYPATDGTSRLGIHFRFGTISIREKALHAQQLNDTFLNELIWREFYAQILDHFPKVVEKSFREKYDFIEWRNDEDEFQKWCHGKTGYAMVDAGMRQLNQTGYMHNRVRMITASFLTKHLLIDWRWGEAYFARMLLDYDLASNNGGWQWAAGCGTDAAPYFRIFNPYSQQEKFDKNFDYIKKWVPEYHTDDYPEPIVDHKFARERCLNVYKTGLEAAKKN